MAVTRKQQAARLKQMRSTPGGRFADEARRYLRSLGWNAIMQTNIDLHSIIGYNDVLVTRELVFKFKGHRVSMRGRRKGAR